MDEEQDQEIRQRASARVRQADIARAAGVSQATVSLVLSDGEAAGRRIAVVTRRRVLEVAQELGYSVNPAARSLAGGRNRLLGVYTFEAVFPSRDRDFYNPFLVTIEQEAERAGYDLLLFTSATLPDQRRSIYAGGVNRLALADGCILLGRREDQAEVARLAREGFPFVYVGRREIPDCEFSYVAADYAAATARVVSHLVGLGHRSIAYLGSYRPKAPDRDREEGWHAAVQRAGIGEEEARVLRLGRRREIETVIARLRDDGGCTALVLEHPETAERFFTVIAGMGLEVPADVSVAVLGDVPSTGRSGRRWSGFRIPREEMARQAVRLLLDAIEAPQPHPRNVTVPCLFTAGATVGKAPRTRAGRSAAKGATRPRKTAKGRNR